MKYISKFVNGFHCVFDTVNYENVQITYLRKDCLEAVKRMNQQASR